MSQDFKSANSAKIGKGFSDARENLDLSIETRVSNNQTITSFFDFSYQALP